MNEQDLKILEAKGIAPAQVEAQLSRFKIGFPELEIKDSATVGCGIMRLSEEEQKSAAMRWKQYLSEGGDACKFVPASGAASRMFKSLFNFVDGDSEVPAEGSDVAQVLERIEDFAFYDALNGACEKSYGKTIAELKAEGRNKDIIAGIISASGLNYGQLPKGLLQFHSYAEGSRTPVEEQIAEGAATAVCPGGTLNLHFTVSPNHRALFEQKLAAAVPVAEGKYGIKVNWELSEQKSATDTIAANPDGTPFRNEDGSLLFRPGGHGALIANLGEIKSPVVFIKNIDNVVPDKHRGATVEWKQILAGKLIEVRDTIADYLKELHQGNCPIERQREMIAFLHDTLQVRDPQMKTLSDADLEGFLLAKFNRPLRVCGMVVNEGEPGGGPYIAVNPDGTSSPQILESHQIAPQYKELMAKATHFNPVDLVCYIQDTDGKPFDLTRYVDAATGFISNKSAGGRELLALELPGLWNGAMSDWNTVFVEVPAATFNPVKTVNDLLRPTHQ